jgi:hypothetical protein
MTAAMTTNDRFSSPSPLWFLVLDTGLAATAVLSVSGRTYEKVAAKVPLPPRPVVQALLAGTAVVHVAEAVGAYRFAKARGMDRSAARWAVQTFVVGFPSLLELRKVAAG